MVKRLLVGVQVIMLRHNGEVVPLRLPVGKVIEGFWLLLRKQSADIS